MLLLLYSMFTWIILPSEVPEANLSHIIDDNTKEPDKHLCHLL